MSKTVKTNKGTELPLLNLKGKDYLQVAHRIVWFAEEIKNYTITQEFPVLTDDQTIARVTVTILDESGKVVKQVSDIKRETKKDFPDHTEKAATGALGRCLASLGFGTAYALADLDEGDRLADAPVNMPTKSPAQSTEVKTEDTKATKSGTTTGFRRTGSWA